MSATKSYFEGVLVMDEELTQHDGIAIAATTGNWNSQRGNGHIIGLVGSQLQCASYKVGKWRVARCPNFSHDLCTLSRTRSSNCIFKCLGLLCTSLINDKISAIRKEVWPCVTCLVALLLLVQNRSKFGVIPSETLPCFTSLSANLPRPSVCLLFT